MRRWIRPHFIGLEIAGFLLLVLLPLITYTARISPEMRTKAAMKQAYQIHHALYAYAQGHDGAFPDGKSSNEAFRKLFQAGLLDDGKLFFIKPRIGGGKYPDGDFGTTDDGYAKALEPGECCFYYIRGGLINGGDPSRPIILTKVGGSDGKVFTIVVRVSGQSRVEDPKAEDWFNKEYL